MSTRADLERLLLGSLLEQVSRSFYWTVRVLPARIRSQIGLAYLLARAADTIADTGVIPPEERLGALEALRHRVRGTSGGTVKFDRLSPHQSSLAERLLLERLEACFELLRQFQASDRELVVRVLETITSGQELDLRRFAQASPQNVIALPTAEELEDYTYRVAGCVGEFWTRLCRRHLFPSKSLDDAALIEDGVRFGRGLQLVNILRDLPADIRNGRCYLPQAELRAAGLLPGDLLDPNTESRLRPVYNPWLARARAHLAAGWRYTNTLPRGCARVRLACAWPILIGLATLKLLAQENVLDPSRRIKVSRAKVRSFMVRSVLFYPFPRAWRNLARISEPAAK